MLYFYMTFLHHDLASHISTSYQHLTFIYNTNKSHEEEKNEHRNRIKTGYQGHILTLSTFYCLSEVSG